MPWTLGELLRFGGNSFDSTVLYSGSLKSYPIRLMPSNAAVL